MSSALPIGSKVIVNWTEQGTLCHKTIRGSPSWSPKVVSRPSAPAIHNDDKRCQLTQRLSQRVHRTRSGYLGDTPHAEPRALCDFPHHSITLSFFLELSRSFSPFGLFRPFWSIPWHQLSKGCWRLRARLVCSNVNVAESVWHSPKAMHSSEWILWSAAEAPVVFSRSAHWTDF